MFYYIFKLHNSSISTYKPPASFFDVRKDKIFSGLYKHIDFIAQNFDRYEFAIFKWINSIYSYLGFYTLSKIGEAHSIY